MYRSIGILMLVCLMTAALATPETDKEVLARAEQLQLEFRQGNPGALDPLVKTLEAAVVRSPNNGELWAALGNAYMSQQGQMYQSQPEPDALIAVGKRAQNAYARALAMNKESAALRASHGMAGMSIATLTQDREGLLASIEAMNSAVRQAPRSTTVRLTRAFTTIHLPLDLRDTAAVIEDLSFLLETAPGGRPEDVLHVLLGDVLAETGKLDAARAEYESVSGASSFAAEQSRLRLKELETGAVSPASIAVVRAGIGSRCAMCHAPGTDN